MVYFPETGKPGNGRSEDRSRGVDRTHRQGIP